MRKKLFLAILAASLSVALIAGGTGAWFTAEAEAPVADFKAGTVEIKVDEGTPKFIGMPDNKSIDNIAPGDCATVRWDIQNIGTLDAEVRVRIFLDWLEDEGEVELSTNNVYVAPKGEGWIMADVPDGEDGNILLYYIGGPLTGTYNPDGGEPLPGGITTLPLVIGFDGPDTGNEYQDRTFVVSALVEAVQASNGAPSAVWGADWDNAVAAASFFVGSQAEVYADYFLTGNGSKMICWTGGSGNNGGDNGDGD